MMESYSYRVLSLSARRLLDRVEIEHAHHGGNDNGRLPITYQDFVDYGIDRAAIAPAIREAIALGFLEVTEHGRAGNAEFRSSNQFRLTYLPAAGVTTEHGKGGWNRFESMEDPKAEAVRAREWGSGRSYRPGSSGRDLWAKKQKSSVGKSQESVRETHTEMTKSIDEKPALQVIGEKPAPLSISRGGDRESCTAINKRGGRDADHPVMEESSAGSAGNDNSADRGSTIAA
jgi:hypothetical protein